MIRIPFLTARREARKRALARMGKASSGHLHARERNAVFQRARRARSKA